MGTRIVADTDVIIDFFRGRRRAEEVRDLILSGRLAVTSTTVFELLAGAHTAEQQEDINRLANGLPLLTRNVAEFRRVRGLVLAT